MTHDDADYFRSRAEAERSASKQSLNPSARAAHNGLAKLYDEKVRNGSTKTHVVP